MKKIGIIIFASLGLIFFFTMDIFNKDAVEQVAPRAGIVLGEVDSSKEAQTALQIEKQKIFRRESGNQLAARMKRIVEKIDKFNFPHSVEHGYLSPEEKKEVIALLVDLENIEAELFRQRYKKIREMGP